MIKMSKTKIQSDKIKKTFQISEKEKASSFVILVLLICFGLTYFSLVPIKNNYYANKVNIENTKREIKDLEDKRRILMNFSKTMEEKKSFLSLVESALPKEAKVPEILYSLEKLATPNSVYIGNFSPKIEAEGSNTRTVVGAGGQQTPPQAWKRVELTFDITGNYLNVREFIKDIENNLRIIDIASISVSGGGELTAEKTAAPLRLNIKAYAYYQ